MKKILIMTSVRNENKEKFHIYLQKQFGDKVEVVLGIFSDLTFEIECGKVLVELDGKNASDFYLVYFRGTAGFLSMAETFSIYLKSVDINFFDKYFVNSSFNGDKFASLMRMAVDGVCIVPSFMCWKGAVPKNIEKIVKIFGFPIVAKEVTTQRMQSIYLLNSVEDFCKLPALTKKGGSARYLFQKFINFDKEFRLLVLGSEVRVIHTKTKRDNTTFQLGYHDMNEDPEFLSLDQVSTEIKEAAIKAAEALHIQVAGVDICTETKTGKIYVFEVNRGPGFDYDTPASPEMSEVSKFFEKELSK
ncbi:MAG: hypothetical protein NT162_03905 [Candidatus Woesebacteria bacterium]|nr:hypothetical protein [Candidatus Woesebacteria bacterium]